MKVYQQKEWLFEMYVKRRMNLTDICDLLDKNYNIKITPQALYNWIKKYDLLKYRGKGRKLSVTAKKPKTTANNPARAREKQMRAVAKGRRRAR